jgi:hypothetical protein
MRRIGSNSIGLLLLLLPVTIMAGTQSLPTPQLSPEGQKAYEALLVTEQFEDLAVSSGGKLSELVQAYRVLLKEKDADAAFKALLERATPAGQLYALCGIYYTDHDFFLTVVEKHKVRSDYVRTMFGCIVSKIRVSSIVEVKGPNVVRLSRPDQELDEWPDSHKEITKEGSMLDIVGGGYSSRFSQRYNGQ